MADNDTPHHLHHTNIVRRELGYGDKMKLVKAYGTSKQLRQARTEHGGMMLRPQELSYFVFTRNPFY